MLRVATPNRLAPFFRPLYLEEVLREQTPHIDKLVTINERQLLINTFPLQLSSTATGASASFMTFVPCNESAERSVWTFRLAVWLPITHAAILSAMLRPSSVSKKTSSDMHPRISLFSSMEKQAPGKNSWQLPPCGIASRSQQPFVVVNCAALLSP